MVSDCEELVGVTLRNQVVAELLAGVTVCGTEAGR